MDFILMDIKNFLKKLENGQLEIEAGQWELHKDLTNVKFAIGELKNLKEDVEKMRLSSMQQMNLIKAVQEKIEAIKQDRLEDRPVTVSERSVKYEKVYRRPFDRQSSPKGYKKRKNRIIRSEEIIEITSQMSNEKSESEQEDSTSKAEGRGPKVVFERKSSQSKSNSQYSCFTNNDILQRYLEDSAKYMDRKRSRVTELIYNSSKQGSSENNKTHSDAEYTSFWDEYGSRGVSNAEYEQRDSSKKDDSSETIEAKISLMPKKLLCPNCPRKFAYKKDFLKHEKNHRRVKIVLYCQICGKAFCSKNRLKEHEAVHRATSVGSSGFKCSYCNQICSTPEKLTSHLRECRIIMKHHFKRK